MKQKLPMIKVDFAAETILTDRAKAVLFSVIRATLRDWKEEAI